MTNLIKLNRTSLNTQSNIEIAKTVIHELIHAYLNIKMANCTLGATIPEINNLNFQELINVYYQNFNCHIDVNGSPQSQHVFFQDFMMPVFKIILLEIKDLLISTEHQAALLQESFYNLNTEQNEPFNWNDFLINMCFSGLQNTNDFANNIQSNQGNYDRYLFYVQMASMVTSECN